ncbi:MAG: manganese-binding transcriptional regulator MntR [Candidatus Sumerlaeia bacterium]|nr:manganese-binding transcriptional regulator MntR [Candidatus Sumerlaeia bacterium]
MPNPLENTYARSRLAHAAENTSDYLEVIADLIARRGEARLVDIAERIGVSKATANKTLLRLQREGFITSEPYRSIFLSDAGRKLAEESKRRHLIVLAFLRAAGVSEDTAQVDAEGMEHHASEETLAMLERLTASLRREA